MPVFKNEDTHGQRIESFRITAGFPSGAQYALYEGTCVGNRKICILTDPFADQNPLTNDSEAEMSYITIQITAARDEVFIRDIAVY